MLQEYMFDSPEASGGEGGYLRLGNGRSYAKTLMCDLSNFGGMGVIAYWKTWLHDNGRDR